MVILINLLALLLVVGISWFGMMWLAGRFHRNDDIELPSRAPRREPSSLDEDTPCRSCKGSGARHKLGRLEPCPICEGTGVERATL